MDPAEPALYDEYALRARIEYSISKDHCVGRVFSSQSDVCFEIFRDVVLFDVGRTGLCQQHSLVKVAEDTILNDYD